MSWVSTANNNKRHLNSTLQFTKYFHIHCLIWSLEQNYNVDYYLHFSVQRYHMTCRSHRTDKPQSPDFHWVSWLWVPCFLLDKIFDPLLWGIFVFGLRKKYFQCRFWSSWASFSLNLPEDREWEKTNSQIMYTAMESVILFQDFMKENYSFGMLGIGTSIAAVKSYLFGTI